MLCLLCLLLPATETPAAAPASHAPSPPSSLLPPQLALAKAADTLIGSEFVRGVSGGERKRANIGVEIISNPSLIFLE